MTTRLFMGTIAATALVFNVLASANDDHGRNNFEARLVGGEETPLSISTTGHGQLRLHINNVTGAEPYRISGSPSFVPSPATIRSHAMASSRPPARA